MRRRQALAAVAGLGLTGGSAWIAKNGIPGRESTASRLPITVETLDARGSSAGETPVPIPGSVTVVDLFATWCPPCDEQLAILDDVRSSYPSVEFVSVTNERPSDALTREDIAAWWNDHDGNWTLGLDPGSDLLAAFGASGLPYVAIADADGSIRFQDGGLVEAGPLRRELDELV
ncbi:thioredoxin [Salinarchaeum sp. Harcht-Bsk1]|uniref:TlpA family protein disulfide reductase n=1 Tax=Salinarchaeum sp. Harcht-Bsk1 TaxID=1333523 RepID=UPI0003423CAA|nr:TlpA disulfide reductase family protein [Salinarchaeum sp. Harcht-Bsk1]AGN01641.1 thioredoxin [Salinarchaeum sp. Harcht-Bsk1]